MSKNLIIALVFGLTLNAVHANTNVATYATAAANKGKVWITLGDAAYQELVKALPQTIAKQSNIVSTGLGIQAGKEKIHLVQVDEKQMLALTSIVHAKLKRCGGFAFHPNEASGVAALSGPVNAASFNSFAAPKYTITNQAIVNPMLGQMQATNIGQTIVDFSAFTNRYYTTNNGVNASNWLKSKWQTMSAGRTDITVEQFAHSAWSQKSVILTITGTEAPSEVVILGAHLDTINTNGTSENTSAPGADDDASGIASITEILRVMVANNYKPKRTLKLIGYSAEEVGLRGSKEIAAKFKSTNVNVVGVMQLDMTNYKGSNKDIYLYTDYTNSAQNTYVANLIGAYLPTLVIGYDQCGYACSDHASWTEQGYATSMPFESQMDQYNPNIHTASDTFANSGNQANHSLKFAKMALAYLVEMGSEGAAIPSGGVLVKDTVKTIAGATGSSAFYTFAVPAGATNLTFKTSGGSGDADLYVQLGTNPSTTAFLAKSDGSTTLENIAIAAPTAGTYNLLVDGYAAYSNVALVASYTANNPGGCTPSATVLCSGSAANNISLALNAMNTYSIVVPAGKTSLTIKLSGGTGDGDLYTRLGSAPTTKVFDQKSDGFTNTETITVSTPVAGTYYVLVKAYAAVAGASLLATVQ